VYEKSDGALPFRQPDEGLVETSVHLAHFLRADIDRQQDRSVPLSLTSCSGLSDAEYVANRIGHFGDARPMFPRPSQGFSAGVASRIHAVSTDERAT
jgi:hypothetical protein